MAYAALRVGYLLASPDIVREINKAVLPYNLNVFSQIAAEVAMENYERELGPLVQQILSERDRLFAELSRIDGLTPVESEANFILVKSAAEPKRIFADLLKHDRSEERRVGKECRSRWSP